MTTPKIFPVLKIFYFSVFIFCLCGGSWASSQCASGEAVRIWTAPLTPQPGAPLNILAVATDSDLTELWVTDPAGKKSKLSPTKGGGPPWSLRGKLSHPVQGTYRIETLRSGQVVACSEIRIGSGEKTRSANTWDLATQAFFAAWVEQLFDAPPDETLSFPSLEPILRDPSRNVLFNYLRHDEDLQVRAEPDCADLPYFLHAYFSWKLGLPFSDRSCSRGSSDSAPSCGSPEFDTSFVNNEAPAATFRQASVRLMDRVHSGSGRTALHDDATDFYPVPLQRSALWPGTVFADPYGHTLIIVKWIPQTEKRAGLLLAVDAQPDNSVARKRFWEGNFLFARTPSAGPGFKAYRVPVKIDSNDWTHLSNKQLATRIDMIPYSSEQSALAPEEFYARMDKLINPLGLSPEEAYATTLDALMEQLETRVRSVNNGEEFMRTHPSTLVEMPKGSAIFETTGPWEDYSTPARDMRVLIAMKVLAELPERISHHPELYLLNGESPKEASERIKQLHTKSLQDHFISYTRSDGSPWELSLAEIYARRTALEIAYNPNDCVERRWGATPDTADFDTCNRRAPAAQQILMEEYRPWFREARRPPR